MRIEKLSQSAESANRLCLSFSTTFIFYQARVKSSVDRIPNLRLKIQNPKSIMQNKWGKIGRWILEIGFHPTLFFSSFVLNFED